MFCKNFSLLFCFLLFSGNAFSSAPAIPTEYCLDCLTPSGLTATALPSGNFLLQWDAVPGALSFNIEVQEEQNPAGGLHLEINSSSNSVEIQGLQSGTPYKFKVRTQCAGDKSDWSTWLAFTGSNGGGNGSCGVPTGLQATNVAADTLTLTWDAVPGATSYTIEIEDEQNVPSNFHLEINVATNTFTFTGANAGVQYKFRVRAQCGNGQSDYSPWLFFNSTNSGGGNNGGGNGSACAIPVGLDVMNLTANSATLIWTAVPGALGYTVEVERDNKSGAVNAPWKLTLQTSTNSVDISGLNANKKYKFKVRTICAPGQHSGWSKSFRFQTPVNFSNPSVDDRSSDSPLETNLDLRMSPNPAAAQVTLSIQIAEPQTLQLSIFSIDGKKCAEQMLEIAQNTDIALPLDELQTGIYFVQIRSASEQITKRLIVQH